MNDSRYNVLGVKVSAVNLDTAVRAVLEAARAGRRGYVCVTGVHGVMECRDDPELKAIHNRSLLTVPDGMPLVWLGRRRLGKCVGRVYGPDLMARICAVTAGENDESSLLGDRGGEGRGTNVERRTSNIEPPTSNGEHPAFSTRQPHSSRPAAERRLTHFLYGATEDILRRLKAGLEEQFPGIRIVGAFAPPFRPLTDGEEEDLRRQAAACKPDFFWVGLSTPKQERFMASAAGRLDCGVMIGVGAAFDIHAGLRRDAPRWVMRLGLQWLWRLCREPRRLWRRYLRIVPGFMWALVKAQLGGGREGLGDCEL